jgi:transcriptional regulator with XRE-family HTH domain
MDLDTSFGRWLRARRRALDLTQGDLARQVSCSVETIRKIEADERRPSRQIAERMANCLKIPADERPAIITLARGEPYLDSSPMEVSERTVHAPQRPPTNLPAPLTRLIGRKQDIAAVRNVLLRGAARLLTLVGPPGIGKTSLSIAVARDIRATFSDGAYFVALAPLGNSALVLPTIAQTLGIRETAGQPLLDRLKAALQAQRLLLLLDNFEHLLDTAPLVVELLEACPGLKALVTSRAALHVRGERLYARDRRVGAHPGGNAVRGARPGGATTLPADRAERSSRGGDLRAAGRAATVDRAGSDANQALATGRFAGTTGAAALRVG